MEDLQIIEALFARRESALGELGERYGAYCSAIAQNILHSREEAEECVADVWLRVWDSIPPNRPNSLKHYVGRITRNLALNRYRDANAEKRRGVCVPLEELGECIPGGLDAQQMVEGRELVELLNRFTRGLPGRERNVFLRRYYLAQEVPAIARACAMTPGHVNVMLHRLRKKLRKLLEQEGYAP